MVCMWAQSQMTVGTSFIAYPATLLTLTSLLPDSVLLWMSTPGGVGPFFSEGSFEPRGLRSRPEMRCVKLLIMDGHFLRGLPNSKLKCYGQEATSTIDRLSTITPAQPQNRLRERLRLGTASGTCSLLVLIAAVRGGGAGHSANN